MTDLVARLRDAASHPALLRGSAGVCSAAADEIEELRALLSHVLTFAQFRPLRNGQTTQSEWSTPRCPMSERERFEKWWAEYRGFNDPHDGEAWAAWQAALAAAPAPEPVAWKDTLYSTDEIGHETQEAVLLGYEGWESLPDGTDLYAAPKETP